MDEKIYKTFYGGWSTNTVGFCCKHYLSLTSQQLETRHCTRRQCRYLLRHPNPYWDEKAEKKQRRKDRKAALEKRYQEAIHATKNNTNPV